MSTNHSFCDENGLIIVLRKLKAYIGKTSGLFSYSPTFDDLTEKENHQYLDTVALTSIITKLKTYIDELAKKCRSLTVSPTSISLSGSYGKTQQISCTLVPTDTTDTISYTSSNTSIATVSSSGLVTSVAPGSCTITVTCGQQSKTISCSVAQWVYVTGISVSPTSMSFSGSYNKTQEITVYLDYNTGYTEEVTNDCNYDSSSTSVASVSDSGVVTSKGKGSCTITVQYGAWEENISVSVAEYVYLTGITISPSSSTSLTSKGATKSITVTANYNNGTTLNVTSSASYSSNDTSIATVSSSGTITAVSGGYATITVSYSGYSQSLTVDVYWAESVTVSPSSLTLDVGDTGTLTATCYWSDGDNTTNAGSWSSSNTNIATVSGGTVTGKGAGSCNIYHTWQGCSDYASVTVINPVVLSSISISKSSIGFTDSYTYDYVSVTATFSNGSTSTVTSSCSWSSSNSSVASASNGTVTSGTTGGSCTITASYTYNGTTKTDSISVTNTIISSISLSPSSISLGANASQSISVTGTWSDGSTKTISASSCSWSSSNTSIATVSSGTVTSKSTEGSCTITATYLGKSDSTSVSVTPVVLQSISVSSSSITIDNDDEPSSRSWDYESVTVTANYSDGTTKNVTSSASYSSSSPSVAKASSGTITGTGEGSTTITVSYTDNGVTKSATISVTCRIVVNECSISLDEHTVFVADGNVNYTIDVQPSDVSINKINVWSTNTSVATVTNNGLSGTVTPVGAGTALIECNVTDKYGNSTPDRNDSITVYEDLEVSITSSSGEYISSFNVGDSVTFTASATGGVSPYTYSWNVEENGNSVSKTSGTGKTFTFRVTGKSSSTYDNSTTVSCTVTDSAGNSNDAYIGFYVE